MDNTKLKINHIDIIEGKVYLALNFLDNEYIKTAQNLSRGYFEKEWTGRKIRIIGVDYDILSKINHIQCTSNIIEMKNFHVLTDLTKIGDIKENDILEIL